MRGFSELVVLFSLTTGMVSNNYQSDIAKEPLINPNIVTPYDTSQIEKKSLLRYQMIQQKLEEQQKQDTIKQQEEVVQQQQTNFKNFVDTIRYNDTTQIDLHKPSGLTPELADELLKGTGLEGLGKAFVGAEQEYGVNAYYLMAHAAWESSWGTSPLARYKNNLYGYQAYDSNPYNDARSFDSKADCVYSVAKYVSIHYLNANGDCYRGPNLSGMNIHYASDKSWATGIAGIMDHFVLQCAKIEGV